MPKTHTYTTYEYEELNQEAKKNAIHAIRKYRSDIPHDLHGWHTQCLIDLKSMGFYNIDETRMKQKGFTFEYSLNHCQGDGVAFYGSVDVVKLLTYFSETSDKDSFITEARRAEAKEMLEKLKSVFEEVWETEITSSTGSHLTVVSKKNYNANWYSHSNTMDFDWLNSPESIALDYELDLDGGVEIPKFKKAGDEVLQFVEETLRRVSKGFEASGYEELEWLDSDEYLVEYVGDFDFNEDGSIFQRK